MRARVARPRGHRPGRGGACLARAHAVAPAGAGRVQPALVVDARRRRRLQRRRSAALGAVRREPDPPADRGAARGARARRGRRRTSSSAPRRSRRASAPTWRGPPRPTGPASAERPVTFFCAEYGIHASLPIYSGGLGALAGDILKEASDRALPLVAVGLLYRQGYFRQRIDASGWQHESWVPTDPERQPMALVTGDDGQPITVTVPVGAEQVVAQVWRVDVGRVPLFLLDADRPENGAVARWISSRLYTGTRDLRLAQYLLLGVGGMRALRGDGHRPVRRAPQRGPRRLRLAGAGPRRAGGAAPRSTTRWPRPARARSSPRTRRCRPATTPTSPSSCASRWARWPTRSASTSTRSLRLGRTHPDDDGEPFGVTQFALHTSRSGNGVSRRHGEVAREMWAALWPDRAVDDVPIGYVTNGVHLPTWVGDPMRALLDRHLGEGWMDRAADPATWDAARPRRRRRPVGRAPRAARRARRPGRASAAWSTASVATSRASTSRRRDFDPDVLTIGFARRLATYKRLHVLLQSAEGIVDLLLGRAQDPDPHGGQGAPARRRRQAQPAGAVRGQGHPRDRLPRRLPRRLRPHHRRAARHAAATCGSTCRARRSRPAARAG